MNSLSGSTPWYFIDRTGKTVRSGYATVKHSAETKLWGAMNSTGKCEVFDENGNNVQALSGYEDLYFPNYEGTAEVFSVKKDGKFGVVNRSGTTVIPFDYDLALGNYWDFIPVQKDGKWGAVSPSNVKYVPTNFTNLKMPDTNDATHVWVQDKDSLYYHYNTVTSRLYEQGYKDVQNFKDGMALAIPTNLKVDDTPLNRAQLQIQGTQVNKETADKLMATPYLFGILINTNDEVIMDRPVSPYCKDIIAKEIMTKYGNRKLTDLEEKKVLLQVTRNNRSYDLQSTIGEEEWDY